MAADTQAVPRYRDQSRPPPWRDVRVLRVLFQVAFVLGVGALGSYLYGNFTTNAADQGLETSFDFLDQPTGVNIRDSDFNPSQPVSDALVVGFVNTIRVATVGIALATVLGILIGIGRLSTNWLVRKSAAVYVDTIRNVPVLVIIILFYTAVVLRFPPVTEAIQWFGLLVFSNRGLAVPWGEGGASVNTFLVILAAGLVAAVAVGVWRTRLFDATGQPHHRFLFGLAVFAAVGLVGYLALGAPVTLTLPVLDGRVITGGIEVGPEYAALLIALVVYTSSHIAEIVRGSIQAVPKGQTEASQSLALSGFQRLRYVILPQAFRIMVPPLANQYLNLTKNSSLAIAIGYFDIMQITTQSIGNGNPAPQSYLIVMAAYLTLSLSISLVANIVNRRLALEGR